MDFLGIRPAHHRMRVTTLTMRRARVRALPFFAPALRLQVRCAGPW